MLAVRLRRPKHLTPPKPHQRRCLGDRDPAIHQIAQYAHPVDLRPAHRNHHHRPKTSQSKSWRVTPLSGPTVTSLSGVYSGRSSIVSPRTDSCFEYQRSTALSAILIGQADFMAAVLSANRGKRQQHSCFFRHDAQIAKTHHAQLRAGGRGIGFAGMRFCPDDIDCCV